MTHSLQKHLQRCPSVSRGHRVLTGLLLPALLACVLSASTLRADEASARGKTLLVRGVFTVFSLGLDDLAEELSQGDADVQVVSAALSRAAVDRTICEYVNGNCCGPLVLIGHSLGADLLPGLARRFQASGLSVDLMVMVDSTNPSDPPSNVKRCVNLYQSNASPEWFRLFRGAPICARSDATELVNIDIRKLAHQGEANGINHFNIEASTWVQQMVVKEVRGVASGSAMDSVVGARSETESQDEDEPRVASRPLAASASLSDSVPAEIDNSTEEPCP